jgi:hypothetical protein
MLSSLRTVELKVDKSRMQCAVDIGIKDYNLLMEGNKSLLAECNDFQYRCQDLQVELR